MMFPMWYEGLGRGRGITINWYMYQLGLCSTGQGERLKEVLDALKAYTEIYYRRVEELVDEIHLVEYCIRRGDM